MQRPNAGASQHRKCGLGNHGHVDQHAIALLHTQRLQDGGHALDFGMQLVVAVDALSVFFRGNRDQRVLIAACGQMAVYRVVAQIGGATHKPARKRRVAVITNLLRRGFPVDELGLFGPKGVTIFDGATVKLCKAGHGLGLLIVSQHFFASARFLRAVRFRNFVQLRRKHYEMRSLRQSD